MGFKTIERFLGVSHVSGRDDKAFNDYFLPHGDK